MEIKLCWFCEHFCYTNAHEDWGEYTPGWDFQIACSKKHWEFDPFETKQEEFGNMLSSANECKDFERRIV